ncbi:MAG: cob(I)yrinic acid a,c-diamide adenosyltransferase, partial [Kaistella sp.]
SDPERTSDLPAKYLNRLSDYLFVLARYVSKINGEKEEYWNPNDR